MIDTVGQDGRPLLLIDVDGVTNVFGAWFPTDTTVYDEQDMRRASPRFPEHLREARAGRFKVLLNPEHPQWFARAEKLFECVHATMWQADVYLFAQVAGYGQDWDYIDFDGAQLRLQRRGSDRRVGAGITEYKWPGLLQTIGDRPVVYVDDDLTNAQLVWARERNASGIPTLFLRPSPRTGMLRSHFNRILAFSARVSDASLVS